MKCFNYVSHGLFWMKHVQKQPNTGSFTKIDQATLYTQTNNENHNSKSKNKNNLNRTV